MNVNGIYKNSLPNAEASRKSDRYSDLVRSPEENRNSTSTVRSGSPVPADTDDQK